jgi:hypothetical protein
VYIQTSHASLVPISFKFSSTQTPDGKTSSFLFVFDEIHKEKNLSVPSNVMLESFDKFETLLIQNLDNSPKRMTQFYQNIQLLYRLTTGDIPGLLSNLDVGDSVRKVIGRKVGLSYEYNVDLINSTPISPPLPIKTNGFVLEKAIEKIVELGIFIASRSTNKFVIVSTGCSEENIFVFVKITVYENFPWNEAEELLKPFFGKLGREEKLLQASGLEGYLAENLLKSKGFEGGITGQKFDDGVNNPQIILTVILPFVSGTPRSKGTA